MQRAHGGFVQITSAEGGDYAGGIQLRWDPKSPHDFDAQEALNMLNRYDVRQRSACTSWMSSEFGINWSDLCRMW